MAGVSRQGLPESPLPNHCPSRRRLLPPPPRGPVASVYIEAPEALVHLFLVVILYHTYRCSSYATPSAPSSLQALPVRTLCPPSFPPPSSLHLSSPTPSSLFIENACQHGASVAGTNLLTFPPFLPSPPPSLLDMGFNAVLTALLYIFYVAGTYHVLQRSKMPLAVRKGREGGREGGENCTGALSERGRGREEGREEI